MKKSEYRAFGHFGESVAADFLSAHGYRVICRNRVLGGGELDLVCEGDGCLVFVEVKTRADSDSLLRYGRPAASVTPQKIRCLLSAAREYLRINCSSLPVRIDVVEVVIERFESGGESWYCARSITHMVSAVRG